MAEFRHETDRLVLRDWRADDANRFYALLNTPAVMRWLGGVQDRGVFDAAVARIEGYRRDFGHTFWIVERKADGGHLAGELIGFCGLKRSNVEGEKVFGMVEVGWRLREDAWGHGFAKEGAIASLDLAFDRFAAEEVVALTVAGNAPSWGMMERLGMVRAAELDFNDPRYGPDLNPTIVYRIDRGAWTARRQELIA